MSMSSNSSRAPQDTVNQALVHAPVPAQAPARRTPGWTIVQRLEKSVISKEWCIALPLIPSPQTPLLTTMIHLRSPELRVVENWRLNQLLEQFSWSFPQVQEVTKLENGRMEEHRALGLPFNATPLKQNLSRNLFWTGQFPAEVEGARLIFTEDLKAQWIIEHSGPLLSSTGEYLHSFLKKRGFLASPGNWLAILEEEEIMSRIEEGQQPPRGALPTNQTNFPMKFLLWNCRGGAESPGFRRNFMDMVGRHNPNIVCITETRIAGEGARNICMSLGFDRCFVADPVGFAGGMWLMWMSCSVECDVIAVSQQEIHASVQVLSSPS